LLSEQRFCNVRNLKLPSLNFNPGCIKVVDTFRGPSNGTVWQVADAGGGAYYLRCISDVPGPRWLEARAGDYKITLSATMQPSCKWEITHHMTAFERLNQYYGTRPQR
jgi:hypothetical protein